MPEYEVLIPVRGYRTIRLPAASPQEAVHKARDLTFPDYDVFVDNLEVDPDSGTYRVWLSEEDEANILYAEDAEGRDVTEEYSSRLR